METKCLSITCWNIQGLKSFAFRTKGRDPDFTREIGNTDVIILQETWSRGEESTGCPPGYKEIIVPSIKKKGITQGRDSGGMLIWFKTNLIHSIDIVKKGDFSIWLKIKKGTFSVEEDVYLCATYIHPSESPYFKEESFSMLEDEISQYQAHGKVVICGDLNARTATAPDYINNQGDKHITDINIAMPTYPPRQNYDQITNQNGRQLLQLCRSLGLAITNGRLWGDSYGRYTHCSHLGSSTVDYMLTDIDPVHLKAFTVSPQTPISDHSRITLYIKQTQAHHTDGENNKLQRAELAYKWDKNSKEHYQQVAGNNRIQSALNTFITKTHPQNQEGVNMAVRDLNNIFDDLATLANLKKPQKPQNRNHKDEKWFDLECKRLRRSFRNLSNQKHREPDNQQIRNKYLQTLKQYRHTIKLKKTQHTKQQLTEMEDALDSNKFWENWKHLNKPHKEDLAIQNGDIWKTHFETLYRDITPNESQNSINKKLELLESIIKDQQNPLDLPITERELQIKIKALQPKKACGADGILNEMIKYTDNTFRTAILKLFNLVISTGYFPDIWNQGLITPIFKNGDKSDPNNYRGICVSSNLGKMFCSIINTRLQKFLNDHNILKKSQIGFLQNHRTTDHIYTLHTLIEKHVNQNRSKIYSCFIDFEKAFDSIWHKGLLLRLLESGVGGKTYDTIKSMYLNNKCAVKIDENRTDYFPQKRGVMQGNCLSPTLFNIYINELAKTLENSPAPGLSLNNTEIKCLLYADDLVLLSNSKEGLQQLLDHLQQFCQTWALTVNLKKTKIMIFQKRSRCQGNRLQFVLGSTTINNTYTYTYLGLKLSSTGNFNRAVKDLKEKARRALYAI